MREEVTAQMKREVDERARAAEEAQNAKLSAVEEYKAQVVQRLTAYHEREEDTIERLGAFNVALPPDQIQKFVQEEQRRTLDDDVSRMIYQLAGQMSQNDPGQLNKGTPSRRRRW